MQYLTDIDLAGERGCILSDCGTYRLRLWREWDKTLPTLTAMLLNPSKASHLVTDPTDTRIYTRDRLTPGDTFTGPAIISEYSSATVLPPRDRLRVDALRNLVIEVHP